MLKSVIEAYELLRTLGASERLLTHVQLVGEAGEEILDAARDLGVHVDEDLVRLGIAIHDAGKILHPDELTDVGSNHEASGMQLMLENGVQESIARCCVSHGDYYQEGIAIEELLVALADKLWKGKREYILEELITDRLAKMSHVDRWSIEAPLNACFEKVARQGDERLLRSRRSTASG
ncbi:MAG: HD domain-containing protein [Pseudomonadota bacterium]